MPDLDLIKQEEQGVRDRRGRFTRGRSGNPAGRPRGCRDHINGTARLLLAGEGEALTRKAVELALAGDPTALRLCLERVLPPCRDRMVMFAFPTGQSPWAEGPRHRSGDEGGYLGACRRVITAGEAATIAAELAVPDLDLIKQGEQEVRDRRERLATGRSGNPAGRPRDWRSTPLSGRSRPAISSGACGSSRPTTSTSRGQGPA